MEQTPYEKEVLEAKKKILKYKISAESNVVAIIYKRPEFIYDCSLTIDDFSYNAWKVYFKIAYDLLIGEKKNVIDEVTIGVYLEKHQKLLAKYEEYGGYKTVMDIATYVQESNFSAYVSELKKWETVYKLSEYGFPVGQHLSEYADMNEEEIYEELEKALNHAFTSIVENVKSYNGFDNITGLIDELNEGSEIGMPLYNADVLTNEIGGFNFNGNIYGLGAGSGVGKSTMAFNYLVPSCIKYNQQIVFIINEEDERKLKKELLIWVANNIYNANLQKRVIRDGHFDDETMALLRKCADWIEDKKEQNILTIIPLERYSVNIATKIIRKYSAMGVRLFVLDTLKESFDANTTEIYKSMMRDMVTLYDVVKPSNKNVGLFVTYQLGKGALKMRHLTNNEIGQAKSILDVMSVNLMMRRPYEDECEGGAKELKCWKVTNKSKIAYHIPPDNNCMITFITKNRFGATDRYQILSECDLSTNVYKDIGYCTVPQDW